MASKLSSFANRLGRHRPTFMAAVSLAAYFPVLLFVNERVAQLMWISGPSMYPFLNTDYNRTTRQDVVLVSMFSPWKNLERGTVVTFWSPTNPENMVVKRVVALEGDEVETRPPYPFPTEIVPVGHVWVEGENPELHKTMDSNWYGPIPKSLLVGQLKAVVWPWSKVGFIQWQDYKGSPRVHKQKHKIIKTEIHTA